MDGADVVMLVISDAGISRWRKSVGPWPISNAL